MKTYQVKYRRGGSFDMVALVGGKTYQRRTGRLSELQRFFTEYGASGTSMFNLLCWAGGRGKAGETLTVVQRSVRHISVDIRIEKKGRKHDQDN